MICDFDGWITTVTFCVAINFLISPFHFPFVPPPPLRGISRQKLPIIVPGAAEGAQKGLGWEELKEFDLLALLRGPS